MARQGNARNRGMGGSLLLFLVLQGLVAAVLVLAVPDVRPSTWLAIPDVRPSTRVAVPDVRSLEVRVFEVLPLVSVFLDTAPLWRYLAAIAAIAGIVLTARRWRKAPLYWLGFFLLTLLYAALDAGARKTLGAQLPILRPHISREMEQALPAGARVSQAWIVVCLAGMAYWGFARRVRESLAGGGPEEGPAPKDLAVATPSADAEAERPVLAPRGGIPLAAGLLIAKIVLSLFVLLAFLRLDLLAEEIRTAAEQMGTPSVWELQRAIRESPAIGGWGQAVTFALVAGALVSAGLFLELLRWLHTMHRNLRALRFSPRFDSRWAVLGFLVPGLNLVRPYQVAREVWRGSRPRRQPWEARGGGGGPWVLLAWGAWLVTAGTWASLFLARYAQSTPLFSHREYLLAHQALAALACGLTLVVFYQVERRQRLRWLQAGEGRPPRRPRELGPRHGIQAALLGLSGSLALGWGASLTGQSSNLHLVLSTQVAMLLGSVVILVRKDWSFMGEPGPWRRGRTLVGSVIAGAGLSLAWIALLFHAFRPFLERAGRGFGGRQPSGTEAFGSLMALLIFAPVVEELVFRGAILGSFRRGWSRVPAILLSSLLFACLHLQPVQMLGTFVLGVLCATVRWASGSLLPAVALHAVYNLGAVVLLSPWLKEHVRTPGLLWSGLVLVGVGLLIASSGGGVVVRSTKIAAADE